MMMRILCFIFTLQNDIIFLGLLVLVWFLKFSWDGSFQEEKQVNSTSSRSFVTKRCWQVAISPAVVTANNKMSVYEPTDMPAKPEFNHARISYEVPWNRYWNAVVRSCTDLVESATTWWVV